MKNIETILHINNNIGQPMMLLGPSAALLKFYEGIYFISAHQKNDFEKLYLWTGVFGGIWLIGFAITSRVAHFLKITRFTRDIYNVLIGVIIIVDVLRYLWEYYEDDTINFTREKSFLTTIVLFGTAWILYQVNKFRLSNVFPYPAREILTVAGMGLAIVLVILYSQYITDNNTDKRTVIDMTTNETTIYEPFIIDEVWYNITESMKSKWDVKHLSRDLLSMPPNKRNGPAAGELDEIGFITAVCSGFLLSLLCIIETVICSQTISKFKYSTTVTLYWDLLVIGILNIISGYFMYPFLSASIALSAINIKCATQTYGIIIQFNTSDLI